MIQMKMVTLRIDISAIPQKLVLSELSAAISAKDQKVKRELARTPQSRNRPLAEIETPK